MDLSVCLNMCVEERGEERYCWRAGVMSRDEGERGGGTLRVDGFLFFESAVFVERDSGERRHVCL